MNKEDKKIETETILGLIAEARIKSFKLWAAQVLTEHNREFEATKGSAKESEFSKWASRAQEEKRLLDANEVLIIALLNEAGMKSLKSERECELFANKYLDEVPQLTNEQESEILEAHFGFLGTAADLVEAYPSSDIAK